MTNTVDRRRVSAILDGHHWPQPRALLPLVERRAFRADTRRGFVPAPRYVCVECGLEARSPDILCCPVPMDVALRPGSVQ